MNQDIERTKYFVSLKVYMGVTRRLYFRRRSGTKVCANTTTRDLHFRRRRPTCVKRDYR